MCRKNMRSDFLIFYGCNCDCHRFKHTYAQQFLPANLPYKRSLGICYHYDPEEVRLNRLQWLRVILGLVFSCCAQQCRRKKVKSVRLEWALEMEGYIIMLRWWWRWRWRVKNRKNCVFKRRKGKRKPEMKRMKRNEERFSFLFFGAGGLQWKSRNPNETERVHCTKSDWISSHFIFRIHCCYYHSREVCNTNALQQKELSTSSTTQHTVVEWNNSFLEIMSSILITLNAE
jgi:hypothetical protein